MHSQISQENNSEPYEEQITIQEAKKQNHSLTPPPSQSKSMVILLPNTIDCIEKTESVFNNILQRNLISSLGRIKERECDVLKCGLFVKSIDCLIQRKGRQLLTEALENFKDYQDISEEKERIGKSVESDYGKIMQSVETSLGMESVIGSLRFEKSIISLCNNCKKPVLIQPKLATPFVVNSVKGQENINSKLKYPSIIDQGIFVNDQKIPKKLLNFLPDEVFESVGDQSRSFINIEGISSQLPISKPLQTLPIIPERLQNQLTQHLHRTQPTFPISSFQIMSSPPLPSSPVVRIQKSFIQRLLSEQSECTPRNTSLPYYSSYDFPNIQESQIVSHDKQIFIKPINRFTEIPNIRVVTQPIHLPKFNSRFSESEIKKHITQYRSRSRPSQKIEGVGKKEKPEIGPRRHTFFQTAFYFN